MHFLISPEFWSTLSSVATVIGAAVVVYAAVVAVGQLREMTKTRHLEALLRVYDMIGSATARKQLRIIYTELESKPESLTHEERELVEQVTITFERIGKLVESDLVPMNELFEGHCEVVIRTWKRLEPYIRYHRTLAGGRYAKHFERLAKLAQKYHLEHFPEENLEIVDVWSNGNAPIGRIANNKSLDAVPTSRESVKPMMKDEGAG